MQIKITGIPAIILMLSLFSASTKVFAGQKFDARGYICKDLRSHNIESDCIDRGVKEVEGQKVYRDCWNYAYDKLCNFPSKDDCKNYSNCYHVKDDRCLLEVQNNTTGRSECVNQLKEFSCPDKANITIEKEKMRMGLRSKDGAPQLICKGDIPCLDGNCVDKSFDISRDMMDSVSKLYAVSEAKSNGLNGAKFFEGRALHCTKKPVEYSNCCKLSSEMEGWGEHLGARCSSAEIELMKIRKENKCVYIEKSGGGGLTGSPVKHHFCCWNNILNKVIQVEGRKQLGIKMDRSCRGLSVDELLKLDFSRMDFSEFYLYIKKQMKIPNPGDINARVGSSMSNICKFDETKEQSQQNKRAGVNKAKEGMMGNESDYSK